MYIKHVTFTNITLEHRKRDTQVERDTLVFENQAYIVIEQLNHNNTDTSYHGNISHQQYNTNKHKIKRTQIDLKP